MNIETQGAIGVLLADRPPAQGRAEGSSQAGGLGPNFNPKWTKSEYRQPRREYGDAKVNRRRQFEAYGRMRPRVQRELAHAGTPGRDFPTKVRVPTCSTNLVSEELTKLNQFEKETLPVEGRVQSLVKPVAGDKPSKTQQLCSETIQFSINWRVGFSAPEKWPLGVSQVIRDAAEPSLPAGPLTPESPTQPTQLAESAVTNWFTHTNRTLTARQQRRGFSGVLPIAERQRGDEGNASSPKTSRFHDNIMKALVDHHA